MQGRKRSPDISQSSPIFSPQQQYNFHFSQQHHPHFIYRTVISTHTLLIVKIEKDCVMQLQRTEAEIRRHEQKLRSSVIKHVTSRKRLHWLSMLCRLHFDSGLIYTLHLQRHLVNRLNPVNFRKKKRAEKVAETHFHITQFARKHKNNF